MSNSWHAQVHSYRDWLEVRHRVATHHAVGPDAAAALAHVETTLTDVGTRLGESPGWRAAWTGTTLDTVYGQLHLADCELLRAEPLAEVAARTTDVLSYVRRHLDPDDPRRVAAEAAATQPTTDRSRHRLRVALFGAYTAADDRYRRVRRLRNGLIVGLGVLVLLGILLAVVGALAPETTSPCFTPDGRSVCASRNGGPTGGDTALILFAGVVGAAITGVGALREGQGAGGPYQFPTLLLLLKLPLGAVTGWVGLLLLHGGFVPGLSDLDSPGQIVAWAAVFGAGQQAVSHFVDRRAFETLHDSQGKRAPAVERRTETSGGRTVG